MARRLVVALALGALTCCARPAIHTALPGDQCESAWCATVVPNGDTIEVALTIPPRVAAHTDDVRLTFAEGILGRGFTARAVRLLDGDQERPWPNRFERKSRPRTIRYRVRLDSAPDDFARLREGSFEHERGWHLKGYAFLPQPGVDADDDPPALMRFVLDDGERALGSVVSTENTFHGRHLTELVRATYEIGQPYHHCLRADHGVVCVASSTDQALEDTARFVRTAMQHTASLLGPLDQPATLISIHPAPLPTPLGLSVGSGVVVLAAGPPLETSPTSFALVHEIVHLWHPGGRRVSSLWLREGLAEYLAHVVIARMSTRGEDQFLARILEAHRRTRGRTEAYEVANGDDVYAVGVMAGYCLDRLLEPAGASTALVVRRLLDQVPANAPTMVTDDWFFAELAKTSASSAGYFRLMMQEPDFDFAQCLVARL